MSYKRSRATFEADLHAPFAIFGTPLPDEGERDDGSYLPLWKQEVRDEKGRRRLHGAFTGGWSAGYFNTVGSKEGWTPSTFVSSRASRRKDELGRTLQSAEDYMDEEDLADQAETQALKMSQSFAGLGSSTQGELRAGGLSGLFRADGETMGLLLLRKMGWKDGQGIGPKVRRSARLDVGTGSSAANSETHLFAPENTEMIRFVRKTDRKGLGYNGHEGLSALRSDIDEDEENEDTIRKEPLSLFSKSKAKTKDRKGGIGVGILNDNGSDEEDPYEIGPKIKYNRVIGSGKKKKNKNASAVSNPSLKTAPVFLLKTARGGDSFRRCQDGRLPLDGFVLAKAVEDITAILSNYAPPTPPPGWALSKSASKDGVIVSYISTAEAARASNHDSRSRAAVLGEKSLPGKSVFDYISSTSRERLVEASGKKDLPPGLGEVLERHGTSAEESQKALWDKIPKLDRETAIAAIARGSRGPYADDEAKKARYRQYLEHHTNSKLPLPGKHDGTVDNDYLREMTEFYNCARIFKPMTGFMASRFTTAKGVPGNSSNLLNGEELVSQPEPPRICDPAEEAAKMGMFGNMTRSVEDFFPTRLLCKRFNVKAPTHSRPDDEPETNRRPAESDIRARYDDISESHKLATSLAGSDVSGVHQSTEQTLSADLTASSGIVAESQVNPDRNEAVEGKRANAEVLHAIFGDSDSE